MESGGESNINAVATSRQLYGDVIEFGSPLFTQPSSIR